ncbi:MAG TPA: NAD(P)-binding domain-containing protein [Terriglobales bacterium]
MKVGVLGSGVVGQTLAAGFLKHGHQVFVGTRDPKASDVTAWAEKNPKIEVGTFAQAAEFGELLVLAVLSRIVEDVIKLAGPNNFRGKTLIDTNNPIADAPPVDGVLQYFTQQNHSLGERIQRLLPDAKVVKAFNSVGAVRMVNPHYDQGTPTMFLCGNDATAKAQVSDISRQFGWEPFDCGTIVASRALEPLCILWCIPGLRSNSWTHAFKLLTK